MKTTLGETRMQFRVRRNCLSPALGNGRGNLWRCIIYIVKRTQLYLDDDLWQALHARAQAEGTTISELVREATRERYLGKLEERKRAMQAIIGIRKDRPEFQDSDAYIRGLRHGDRIERLARK